MIDRATIEQILGRRVYDVGLYQVALLHKSLARLHDGKSQELLEFLGDAVYGLAAAEFLLSHLQGCDEGAVTKARIKLVCGSTCAKFARYLGLGPHIQASHNALSLGVRSQNRVLEDAFEATLGAIYVDQGYEAVRSLLQDLFNAHTELIEGLQEETNFKDMLLKHCQANGLEAPLYHTEANGPAHARNFVTKVEIHNCSGTGEGRSKKASEMKAAEEAVNLLNARGLQPPGSTHGSAGQQQ